jgi:hypothetical protein
MKNSLRGPKVVKITLVASLLLLSSFGLAQIWSQMLSEKTSQLQEVSAEKIPRGSTYWSAQRTNYAPLPYNPFPELPVYYLGYGNSYLVDDSSVDYAAIYQQRQEEKAQRELERDLGLMSEEEFWALEGGSGPVLNNYSESDLWIELTGITNDYAYLTLHGTVEFDSYQLLSKTNLAQPGPWKLGEIITGAADTNQTEFSALNVAGVTNQFFRAHHANPVAFVFAAGNGYEPNPLITSNHPGSFFISCSSPDDLTIYYQMSGVAENGVDYTNLPGAVTIPGGAGSVTLEVQPKADIFLEDGESVILTLVPTNTYLIQQQPNDRATVTIWDSSTHVRVYYVNTDGVETNGPPGSAGVTGLFYFERNDDQGITPPLSVYYTMSGTASNGTDYALSGVLNFAEDEPSKYLDVVPLDDNLVEGVETVILTLMPTNTYVIDAGFESQTVTITDTTTTVGIVRVVDAVEPHPNSNVPKQTGRFLISRNDSRGQQPTLTVTYQVSGAATQGVDYTNLTGTVIIPSGVSDTSVYIEPLFDDQLEGDETVIVTLTHTGDGYLINPGFASATNVIVDNIATNTFQRVANLTGLVGIDYHALSNQLIVSINYASGQTSNFVAIYTNMVSSNIVTVITNWSRIAGVPDEVKLATVKASGNGFTNGEVFFGSNKAIGWISADGTRSNINWCVLTNSVQTNALHLRGSLYVDDTGMFSNHVIAVTSDGGPGPGTKKGVWRVDANRNPTLLANLETSHLEGVIVLTNDASKWGPWAGKIITGDEEASPPLIYTIATNGVVTTNDTTALIAGGIHTEDFEIIPPDQDLYVCDLSGNALMKVSRNYFTNFVGQLLITDGGDYGGFHHPARFFALRWDPATTNFVTLKILDYIRDVEHVTFAPINLPPITP